MAVVFAQLIAGGEERGVHALLVPCGRRRRDAAGVRIEDCGPSSGLDGVDNGRDLFDMCACPARGTCSTNRYASSPPDGTTSPIENPDKRFSRCRTLSRAASGVSGRRSPHQGSR